MISFFFGFFCCFTLNLSKKKNAAINFSRHVVMKRNKAKQQQTELWRNATMVNDAAGRYCTFCFAVISNVNFFGKTYTNDNPLFVICSSCTVSPGIKFSASINYNTFFMSNMNLVCGLDSRIV